MVSTLWQEAKERGLEIAFIAYGEFTHYYFNDGIGFNRGIASELSSTTSTMVSCISKSTEMMSRWSGRTVKTRPAGGFIRPKVGHCEYCKTA
jgi:hypothetical protein